MKSSRDTYTDSQACSHLFFAMMCEITQQLGPSFRAPLPGCFLMLSSAFKSHLWNLLFVRWLQTSILSYGTGEFTLAACCQIWRSWVLR